ncbi:MAG: hypothetical protein AAF567_02530 [Actinomycetota bacterium]
MSTPTPNRSFTRLLAVLTLVVAMFATAGVAAAGPADARERVSDRVGHDRPHDRIEQLRLACNVDIVDGERGVLCRWSESTRDNLRGYQLYRIVNGSARQLVGTVAAGERLHIFDTDVAAGDHIIYGVVARNRVGRVIGLGGPVRLGIG